MLSGIVVLVVAFALGGGFALSGGEYQIGSFILSHLAALGIVFAIYSIFGALGLIKLLEVIGSLFRRR